MHKRLVLDFVMVLAAAAYVFIGLDAISPGFDITTGLLEVLLAMAPVGMLAAYQRGRLSQNDR